MSHVLKSLKSLETWLLVQNIIQSKKKDYIKIYITAPLWGESTGHQWIPLTKGQLCRKHFQAMKSSYTQELNLPFTSPLI